MLLQYSAPAEFFCDSVTIILRFIKEKSSWEIFVALSCTRARHRRRPVCPSDYHKPVPCKAQMLKASRVLNQEISQDDDDRKLRQDLTFWPLIAVLVSLHRKSVSRNQFSKSDNR